MTAYGQIQIETSYMAPSNYRDENNRKTGGSGDFKDVRLGIQIPVYAKTDETGRSTAWAIASKGAYAAMDNENLSADFCISQLLNAELGVVHARPLSEKWSLMASAGAGVYTDLSGFSGNCILAQAGTLFIRRMSPDMDLGFGAALNNAIGYPMLFPSLYFRWTTGTRFDVKISIYDTFLLSIGMKMNDRLKIRLLAQARGASAIVERNNETKIFSQQFTVIGLQPEIYVNKLLSIPVTAGVSAKREAYFKDRTLISFYHTEENYPNFAPSFYASVGLKLFFNE
ncbi:MAG: DUF6268 family outer membrane beta-barrel protein [Tannerella sp.]|nr:DUF6268 family outer membrane beta-barrel protein [Tannerella sp.]